MNSPQINRREATV